MLKIDEDDLPSHEEVWNDSDDDQLISKMKSQVPWEDVAFGNHTANDCRNRVEEHFKSVQQHRQQIVIDVEEILTSFRLFVEDQQSKVKFSNDFVATITNLQTLYDKLSPEQCAIYTQKARDLRIELKSNAIPYSSRNARKTSHHPKEPRALFYEYLISTGTETNRKAMSQLYEKLPKYEKYKWISQATQLASTANPVYLSKKEHKIWDSFELKRKKLPTGYNMFVKAESAKNKIKIEEIARKWKGLTDEELKIHIDAARDEKNKRVEAEIAEKEKRGIFGRKRIKLEVETPQTATIEPIVINKNSDESVIADLHVGIDSNSFTVDISKEIKVEDQSLMEPFQNENFDASVTADDPHVGIDSNSFTVDISKEIKVEDQSLMEPSQNKNSDASVTADDPHVGIDSNSFTVDISKEIKVEDQSLMEPSQNENSDASVTADPHVGTCPNSCTEDISKEIKVEDRSLMEPSQNENSDASVTADDPHVGIDSNSFTVDISKEIKVEDQSLMEPSQNENSDGSVTADPHVGTCSNSCTEDTSKEIEVEDRSLMEPSQNENSGESVTADLHVGTCPNSCTEDISKEINVSDQSLTETSQNLSDSDRKCQCNISNDEIMIKYQLPMQSSSDLSNTEYDIKIRIDQIPNKRKLLEDVTSSPIGEPFKLNLVAGCSRPKKPKIVIDVNEDFFKSPQVTYFKLKK